MIRTLLAFAVLIAAGMPVAFNARADDNVFKEIGRDASKASKQVGKTGKEVGKKVGKTAKRVGKEIGKGAKNVGRAFSGN